MPRINRCIELLAQGQPIYYVEVPELGHAAGAEQAGAWADMLLVDFEHHALDLLGLRDFMRGLKAAGPTRSGHPTPTVICALPTTGVSAAEVRANAWQIKQLLATGVHGLLLCHARDPAAVRAFVEISRFPFKTIGVGPDLGDGLRGAGGQRSAAAIWGLSDREYLERADVWPLDPNGELMLGLKIEDRQAVLHAEASAAVPGIAFAEWGPGDMGMSFGYPDRHDPPYPPELNAARGAVKVACDAAGLPFLCGWNDPNLAPDERAAFIINEIGSMIIAGGPDIEAVAAAGRRLTGRTMPV